MAFNHKGPHDRWHVGDNLNVPPHLRGSKASDPMNNTGRSKKKVFGVVLAIIMVLVVLGLYSGLI
jgi:hypothetical protein